MSTANLLESCSDVNDKLGGDNVNYWCWETHKNDYSDTFLIIGLAYMMNLGIILLIYGSSISGLTTQSSMNRISRFGSRIQTFSRFNWLSNQQHQSIQSSDETTKKYIFFILYTIIACLYFIIKIYILTATSSHYLSSINEEFESKEIAKFLDGGGMIIHNLLLI